MDSNSLISIVSGNQALSTPRVTTGEAPVRGPEPPPPPPKDTDQGEDAVVRRESAPREEPLTYTKSAELSQQSQAAPPEPQPTEISEAEEVEVQEEVVAEPAGEEEVSQSAEPSERGASLDVLA